MAPGRRVHERSCTTGETLAVFDVGDPILSSPLPVLGQVYVLTSAGIWYSALDGSSSGRPGVRPCRGPGAT